MLKELNQSIIVLIPKGDIQESCKDFRPINLCNVAYRIIFKVLTNRLQMIIHELITPFENAFAKGRSITDNIRIAHEVLRYICIRRERFTRSALKLIYKRHMSKFLGRSWKTC